MKVDDSQSAKEKETEYKKTESHLALKMLTTCRNKQ